MCYSQKLPAPAADTWISQEVSRGLAEVGVSAVSDHRDEGLASIDLTPIIRGSRRLAMQAQSISRVDGGGCGGTLATRLVSLHLDKTRMIELVALRRTNATGAGSVNGNLQLPRLYVHLRTITTRAVALKRKSRGDRMRTTFQEIQEGDATGNASANLRAG
jgi:hypothetical protein